MADALGELAADAGVRVLIVAGAGGKAFAAGADISRFESERATLDATRALQQGRGRSLRAALQLPTADDRQDPRLLHRRRRQHRRAAATCASPPRTRRSPFPPPRLGLGYGYTGVKRLAEVVGLPAAMDLFYTARRLDAAEALAMHLVNRVVAVTDIDEIVAETARGICENAPMTIAAIKAIAPRAGQAVGGARSRPASMRSVRGPCFDRAHAH